LRHDPAAPGDIEELGLQVLALERGMIGAVAPKAAELHQTNPLSTIRIFFSGADFLRGRRRISRTAASVECFFLGISKLSSRF
jgi:hypothetical protein